MRSSRVLTWNSGWSAAVAVGAVLGTSLLAACSAAPPTGAAPPPVAPQQSYEQTLAGFKQIEEAARKEGKVVIYGTRSEPGTTEDIQFFNRFYPEIEVDFLQTSTPAKLERSRAETATGRRLADVVTIGPGAAEVEICEEGHTIHYTAPTFLDPSVKWDPDPRRQGMDTCFLYATVSPYMFMINTRLVPPDQEPRSWRDLADPKWQGKIALHDPARTGGGNHVFSALRQNVGTDVVRGILANSTIFPQSRDAQARVASGDFAIVVPTSVSGFADFEGAPVKLIVPEEGYVALTVGSGGDVYKDAPHPNAARVWVNFWYTREGQTQSGRTEIPGRSDVAASDNPYLSPHLKRMPGTPFTTEWSKTVSQQDIELARQILRELGKAPG